MKKYGCVCKNCTCHKIHNLLMVAEKTEVEKPHANSLAQPAVHNWGSLLNGLLVFVQSAGMFVIGMIVGAGILMKDPMPNKIMQEKIDTLQKENVELKKSLDLNKVTPNKEKLPEPKQPDTKTADFRIQQSISLK